MRMNLPYTEAVVFSMDGKNYTDELSVITAAVGKILGNPGLTAQVMASSCELAPLLRRTCDLKAPQP